MEQPGRQQSTLLLALMAAAVMFIFVTATGWIILGLAAGKGPGVGIEAAKAELFSKIPLVSSHRPDAVQYRTWRENQPAGEAVDWLEKIRLFLSLGGFISTIIILKREPESSAEHHIRGRRYITGAAALVAFSKASKRECDVSGEGIRLHPTLPPVALGREGRHWLVMGGVGSGKTQTIFPMMLAAMRRGDSLLVYDNKGDFTSKLPARVAYGKTRDGKPAQRTIQPVILAPWDARSTVWSIADDVNDKAAAREFAAAVVPESQGSPMWSNAARQVLTGCIIQLQDTMSGRWGFKDLAQLCFRGAVEDYQSTMREHFPEGLAAVSASNVTSLGILINMQAFLGPVADLAEAWPKAPAAGQGFSLRGWLAEERPLRRVVVIQGNGRFEQLARAFAKSLFTLAAQVVTDPGAMGESRSRRLWIFLDEFPQLQEMGRVAPMLEVGRSKGVRVVLGAQDVAQLRAIYGQDRAAAWQSLIASQIICQLQEGDTANIFSEIIGDREIERITTSQTTGGSNAPAGLFSPGGSRTSNIVRETRPVLLPSQLKSELGPGKKGVNVLWLGYNDALNITIPYTSAEEQRDPVVLADWCASKKMDTAGIEERIAEALTNANTNAAAKVATMPAAVATVPIKPEPATAPATTAVDPLDFLDPGNSRNDDEEGEQGIPASAGIAAAAVVTVTEQEIEPTDVPTGLPTDQPEEPEPAQEKEDLGDLARETVQEQAVQTVLDALVPGAGVVSEVIGGWSGGMAGEVQAGEVAPARSRRKIKKRRELAAGEESTC